ncbi:MAG: acyltransferase family protein, partial [Acidimicrobiales bacterium]
MSTIAATSKRHHYPALDGLRGVAVAAVVGYHLWPAVAPGGWIGVSLFFTLSGFLIVGLVDRGIAAGEFDGHVFYARRARRLLPAAGVTFAAVLVATWISQPELLDRVRGDVVASVAYVANWRQAAEPGGYEAIFDLEPRPLGHIWSLAIEEQVYLVVPGLLVLTRRPVLVLSGLAAVGSAGLWFWWGDADLYFATPVRALEVLAGGALALVVNRRGIPRIPAGPVLGLGLPAMLLLAGTVAETDVVPHPWILPAMAVGLWVPLVAAALSGSGPLESRSLRWLGERSYGVYLFHWPLIELTGWHPVVILGVTLALAEVSYTLVEMPVRMGSLVRTAPISRLLGATSVVALVAVAAPLVSP